MNYRDDDLNNNKSDGGEINFEQINRAAENVKFYNRVIRLSIIVIVLAGAGCGIYLYSFISSGVDNQSAPSVVSEVKPSAKPGQGDKNPSNDKFDEGSTLPVSLPREQQPAVNTSKNVLPAAKTKENKITPSSKKSENKVSASKTTTAGVLLIKDTSEAVFSEATPDTAAVKLGGQKVLLLAAVEDTASAAIKGGSAAAHSSSVEVLAPQPAAPKYEPDFLIIEKHLNLGRYSEFEKELTAALENKDISEAASSRLKILMVKYAYYVAENRALAQKHIAGVTNLSGPAAGDYAALFVNMYAASFKERARKIIDYISDNPAINLSDAQKIELSKALASAGMYDEASRMLNRVIASSDFEADIEFIKARILKYHNSAGYQAAARAVETIDYSIDSTINPDSPFPVKLSKTRVFKYNNAGPVSCLLSENKNMRTLYSYGPDAVAYEINLLSVGNFNFYRIVPETQNFELAGVFDIYNKRHAAVLKRNGKYSLAPINNGATAAEYLPGYFKGKEFDHLFMISPDGKYMARFLTDPKIDNASSLEIINLSDQKVLFKTAGVFCRDKDIEFACFSSDLVKYSIDSVLECRYFYYFKHVTQGGATNENGIGLKFFVYDIDKKEEKAMFLININKAASLNVSYLDSSGCFMLSYAGQKFSAASLKFKSGTWLIKNDLSGSLYLCPDSSRCFNYAPGEKSRSIYFFDEARRTLVLNEITQCGILDYLAYADSVFDYYPEYSSEKLDELKNSKLIKKITASEIKKIDNVSMRQKKEAQKLKTVELLMFVNTCMRSGLTALALDKINAYIKKSESLTDEESYKILELKKEAQKVLEDDK